MTDIQNPTWYSSTYKDEKALLNDVYGQIFGGDAINYVNTKILKWGEIKADELYSNIKLNKNPIIVDFGCGPCFIAKAVKEKFRCNEIICYDVNKDMLEYAKQKQGTNGFKYITCDSTLGVLGQLDNNSVDLVYSFAVFIHYDMYLFVETFEVLQYKIKKGGYFYLQFLPGETFNPKCPIWREHYNIWKKDRNFWTMAMHHVPQQSVINTAKIYGFKKIDLKGHSGVQLPSMVDGPYIPQQEYNGNILFQKI